MNSLSLPSCIKAVIFDFDGTLVASHPVHFLAWKQTMQCYDIDLSSDEFSKLHGYTSDDIAKTLIQQYTLHEKAETISRMKDSMYLNQLSKVQYIPEVKNFLLHCVGNYKLAIGTNEARSVFDTVIRYFKLHLYFDVIVSWDKIIPPKPDPGIFLKCAKLLKLDPQECHVLEDSPRGVEAAQKAGMSYTVVGA